MPMPLFHTAGSVLGVLGCVTTMSTLVLPVLFDPALILDAIERRWVGHVGAVRYDGRGWWTLATRAGTPPGAIRACLRGGPSAAPSYSSPIR